MKNVDKMSRRELIAEVQMWRENCLKSVGVLSPDAIEVIGGHIDAERERLLQEDTEV